MITPGYSPKDDMMNHSINFFILPDAIVSLYSSSKADVDPDLGGAANTFLNEKNP